LGRQSFKTVLNKRDYTEGRTQFNWLYLSRLATAKEYAYMQALYAAGFPTPQPIDNNRHATLMSLIDGITLCKVTALKDPEFVYHQAMDLLVKYAENGLIHGDLNEFNLLVDEDMKLYTIDFPQIVSTSHPDADFYFERDQECIQVFFKRKFNFVCDRRYKLKEILRKNRMDEQVRASGYLNTVSEEDKALQSYLKERAAHANDEEAEDEEEAENGEGEDEMEENNAENNDDGNGNDEIDGQNDENDYNEEFGDIEAEMAMLDKKDDKNTKIVNFDDDVKVVGIEDDKREEQMEEEDQEGEEEELDHEQKLERRKKFRELKKQAKASKINPLLQKKLEEDKLKEKLKAEGVDVEVAQDKKEDEEEEGDSSSGDEGETDLIKRALKKKYRKKKVFKGKKNHPKQFNALVKDQMATF